MTAPSISIAIPAYNAAEWIGETLESVLAQTVAADEIVVVDDGSTDDTAAVAGGFGDSVKLVRQANSGASAAYNRAFAESSSTYVAMCPADDIWHAQKIERQVESLTVHPEIDVAFGGARYFGLNEAAFARPRGEGLLDGALLARQMFEADVIAAPTAVVRRDLWDRLGRFREDLACEDYEFWMRALNAGACFYFDPRLMVRLRAHGGNLSAQALRMWEMNHQVHSAYASSVPRDLARRTLANDLRTIGRCRLGLDQLGPGRDAYRASLRWEPHPVAMAAVAVLALPGAGRALAGRNRRQLR